MEFYYQWFNDYIKVFLSCENPIVRVNYELKKEHTFRVKDNVSIIGKVLNLAEHKLMLCEIIGLFHDVGRFKQYGESFQVFNSENYLQRFFNQLPKNVDMEKVFSHCNNYIDSKIKEA